MSAAVKTKPDYRSLSLHTPVTVLVVDDDALTREYLRAQIEQLGYCVVTAENGRQALDMLISEAIAVDVALMDYEMPVMDGIAAVKRIKEYPRWRNMPIIMITASIAPERMQQGLEAGVFYYLSKMMDEKVFRSVLLAALRESEQVKTLAQELSRHRASFDLINTCKFTFRTLNEAESLAAFMANCFPDPERALWGLCELLINAVEHGNLGLGYDRKTELVASGAWLTEVERLQQSPEHRGKFATATVAHKDNGVYVIVEDQGAGFDWQRYLHIDPARAGDNHGRGIAQANAMSFDKLTYNETGNKAVGFMGRTAGLKW